MILVISDRVNAVTQKKYEEIVNSLDPELLKCPKCNHTGTVVHGYYTRRVKTEAGLVRLRIMRVKCKACGTTHAILLSTIIPYTQITLSETIQIIQSNNNETLSGIMEKNVLIDSDDINHIRSRFKKYWKQRLLSFNISVSDKDICQRCIQLFHCQFMQIRCILCGAYG